ncbi:MAG: hypothetical protein KAS19_13055 [Anaerolineales bacterium]|nr:hypothetical protein [Anaerolineales bacterium]MCK4963416.1 hypothetical protein [Anaerolineales bacterium]
MIINDSVSTITITELWVNWPDEYVELEDVKLEGKKIWDIGDEDPPTEMPPWTSASKDREIKAFSDEVLEFIFKEDDGATALSSYGLIITFDNGCTISR